MSLATFYTWAHVCLVELGQLMPMNVITDYSVGFELADGEDALITGEGEEIRTLYVEHLENFDGYYLD